MVTITMLSKKYCWNITTDDNYIALQAVIKCCTGCNMTGLEPSAADWITTEIEVRIRESHGDDDFINQTGVIRNISVRYSCVVTEN